MSVKNEEELRKCVEACKEVGLVAVTVNDAARTVFDKSTYTVGAVGPCFRKDLPKRVSRLRLFKAWRTQNR